MQRQPPASSVHVYPNNAEDPFEVIVVEEFNLHRSFAFLVAEGNPGAEFLLQLAFQIHHMGVACDGSRFLELLLEAVPEF